MSSKSCSWFLVVGLVAVGWFSPNIGVAQGLVATASVAENGAPATSPALGTTPLSPPPSSPSPALPFDETGRTLVQQGLAYDLSPFPSVGWFASLEADIVSAHISNQSMAPVAVGPAPAATGTAAPFPSFVDQVQLPTAELGFVGSPRVEVGYRFSQGWGEFVVGYHGLVTEGVTDLPGYDVDGSTGILWSRLNLNVVDADYVSREYFLGPYWQMKWRAGGRFASVFFDSLASGNVLEQRISNDFIGGGPHIGLDFWRSLYYPGLAFCARLDGAAVIGQIRQAFEETLANPDGSVAAGGATEVRQTQVVPVLHCQAGLSWAPPAYQWLRVAAGYEFEQWWNLGRAGASNADLTTQGAFIRVELGF
jgi:hypothetical protein